MLRKGRQEPTFSTVGEYAYTGGDEAVEVLGGYGVRFYGSQELEMRPFMARGEDGGFAAMTICVSKPRQNGKSYAARFYALWMAAVNGRRVLYSAHHGKTVRKMFKELRNFVEMTPDFAELLMPNGRGVYGAAGSEGIYFVNDDGTEGGCIEFQTRTNSGARGETFHVIVIDEAQELTDEQLEAMKPTTFAASDLEDGNGGKANDDPQMIYLGTPPNFKCPGTVFRRYHDSAHSDEGSSIWWMEWAAESIPPMDDRDAVMELVYETNPAMGYRIAEKTMRDAMDTMSADGFARECLGWWPEVAREDAAIPAAQWDACRTETPPDGGIVTYAVKFSPDGTTGVLAACRRPDEGKPHVEVIGRRDLVCGIGWFADWISARASEASEIAIDGRSNAQDLEDRLRAAGVPRKALHRPTPSGVGAACSTLVNAVTERRFTHFGQPGLDAAAKGCSKRPIGSDGAFGFRDGPADGEEAVVLEAAALALWRAVNTRRDPRRKMRVL